MLAVREIVESMLASGQNSQERRSARTESARSKQPGVVDEVWHGLMEVAPLPALNREFTTYELKVMEARAPATRARPGLRPARTGGTRRRWLSSRRRDASSSRRTLVRFGTLHRQASRTNTRLPRGLTCSGPEDRTTDRRHAGAAARSSDAPTALDANRKKQRRCQTGDHEEIAFRRGIAHAVKPSPRSAPRPVVAGATCCRRRIRLSRRRSPSPAPAARA